MINEIEPVTVDTVERERERERASFIKYAKIQSLVNNNLNNKIKHRVYGFM